MLTITKYEGAWCNPCKLLTTVIDGIKYKYNDVLFISIDVDSYPDLVIKNKIKSVPTLIFEVNGVEVFRNTGILTHNKLEELINKYR